MNAGRNAAASVGAVSKDKCFGVAPASPLHLEARPHINNA